MPSDGPQGSMVGNPTFPAAEDPAPRMTSARARGEHFLALGHVAWLFVLPVLLLAAGLGAQGLNADAIWYDEYWSVEYAGGAHERDLTLVETWQRVAGSEHELNPPGYYLVLNLWARVAGWSDAALRALSLFAGLLGVAWVFRAGRAMASPRVGVLAAVFVGTSAFYIYYLHEARAYAFFVPLIAMTLWAYWRLIHGRQGWGTSLALFLGVLGILYTHFLAGLFLAALGLYHVLFVPKNWAWWRVAALVALASVPFFPWLRETMAAVNNVGETAGREVFGMDAAELAFQLSYGFSNGVIPLLPVLVAAAALSRARAARVVGCLALVVLVLGIAGDQFLPFLTHIRYMMALVPLVALLFGFAGDWLARRSRLLLAIVMAFWMTAGVVNGLGEHFDDVLFRDIYLPVFRPHLPIHRVADQIGAGLQEGDAVVYYAPQYPWAMAGTFDFYMYPLGVRYLMLSQLPGGDERQDLYNQMTGFLNDSLRVWFVEEEGPERLRRIEFERALRDEGFELCQEVLDLRQLTLQLYSRVEACCCPPDAPREHALVAFRNGAALTYVSPLEMDDNERLALVMAWTVPDTLQREKYSVGVHVLGEDGALLAQADYGLPDRAFQCTMATVDLGALPPGSYPVYAILYEWETGARVPGVSTDAGEPAERHLLGNVVVPET